MSLYNGSWSAYCRQFLGHNDEQLVSLKLRQCPTIERSSWNGESYCDTDDVDQPTVIRLTGPPCKNWKFYDYGGLMWTYSLNKFMSSVLGLSKQEIILCAYRPLVLRHETPTFVHWNTPDHSLSVLTLPQSQEPAYGLSYFFFSSITMSGLLVSNEMYAIATDFLFIESAIELDTELDIKLCVTKWDWIQDDDFPSQVSQINFGLSAQSAILLESPKEAGFLYALPWENSNRILQTRHEVKKYVKKLLKWFNKQASDKETTSPCPSSIIYDPDGCEYTVLFNCSRTVDDIDFYILGVDRVSSMLDTIFKLNTPIFYFEFAFKFPK